MFKFSCSWSAISSLVFIGLLSACGESGYSQNTPNTPNTPNTLPTYKISGGGIKGPLKNAKVSLYIYDQTESSGYGTLISVGKTNELTEITGIEITGLLEEFYILSFESTNETIDISTQKLPIVPKFDTIISSTDIISGKATYASPLSHMAFALMHLKVSTGETIAEAMNQSNLTIKSIFGFGISENINLFNSPSLLITSADSFDEQFEIFQLRKAIEVFSVLSYQLLESLNNDDISMEVILESLAKDILDGHLDGISIFTEQLPYNPEHLSIYQQSLNDLILPNTDNTQVILLGQLLVEEASLLHNEILNTEKLLIETSINNREKITLVVDYDNDGLVNAQDNDDDNDGFEDLDDAFPYDINEWLDSDFDSLGNNTDTDDDNDGVKDDEDAFPLDNSESRDFDADGIGNNSDTDDDNDGALDINDIFPFDESEWLDSDNDGLGNNIDIDDDNDQVLDLYDDFPLDNSESLDTDKDGLGNNSDLDDDNDGVFDSSDDFPLDAGESLDTDSDGLGNIVDTDDDNDGVADGLDVFPLDANEQYDTDFDGIGNNADIDDDNDGEPDVSDFFPLDSSETADNDSDGLGNNTDIDDDNDGIFDIDDAFPFDPSESIDIDLDGVGNNADVDDDNDGFLDIDDVFPNNLNEWLDTDGDGIGNNTDSDDDNDGAYDNDDIFPLDPTESLDFDNDFIGDNADTDDDNDGIVDSEDFIHVGNAGISKFDPEESINFDIRGLYTDGSLLSGNDNWHVQYYIYDLNMDGDRIPFYPENGYYNASFNSSKEEWNISFPAPSYSGEFYVTFTLYCSSGTGFCGSHNNRNYYLKEQSYSFSVNCLRAPCGYKPEVEPGINISASEISNSITASVVRGNGDIIAIYENREQSNWKNYVVKSTNNGNSWHRMGQLPSYASHGSLIELSENEELLFIGPCGRYFCSHSSSNGTYWHAQIISDRSNFANCNEKNCNVNNMSINKIVETEDNAVMVFYQSRVGEKNVTFMTKSYDQYNWSTPVNLFGSEYRTEVFSIIRTENQGFVSAVFSTEDYTLKIYTSEDGEEWSPIKSISTSNDADLIYRNGKLRLLYQKGNDIFETHSTDNVNFSTPKKIVERSSYGFEAIPLTNGNLGVIYNLYLNYQYDLFYQEINLSSP